MKKTPRRVSPSPAACPFVFWDYSAPPFRLRAGRILPSGGAVFNCVHDQLRALNEGRRLLVAHRQWRLTALGEERPEIVQVVAEVVVQPSTKAVEGSRLPAQVDDVAQFGPRRVPHRPRLAALGAALEILFDRLCFRRPKAGQRLRHFNPVCVFRVTWPFRVHHELPKGSPRGMHVRPYAIFYSACFSRFFDIMRWAIDRHDALGGPLFEGCGAPLCRPAMYCRWRMQAWK